LQEEGTAFRKVVERECEGTAMRTFPMLVERCPDTGLLVGSVPGWPGAHSQAETLEELRANMREVIGMLLEDGEPALEAEFVGLESVQVG
jgi:predicted RNase H-like HicB family nuclease